MDAAIVQALVSLGPGGIMCWILLQQMKAEREDRKTERAERLKADLATASALTALAMKITGRPLDGNPS